MQQPAPFTSGRCCHRIPITPPSPDETPCRMILFEIIFDSYHHSALNVTVSCIGGGHSETHVYKLHRGKWTHSHRKRLLSSSSHALKQYGFDLNSSVRLPREADKVTGNSDLKLTCAAQEACGVLGGKPQGFA